MANFTDEDIELFIIQGMTGTKELAQDVQEARQRVKELEIKLKTYEKRFGPISCDHSCGCSEECFK